MNDMCIVVVEKSTTNEKIVHELLSSKLIGVAHMKNDTLELVQGHIPSDELMKLISSRLPIIEELNAYEEGNPVIYVLPVLNVNDLYKKRDEAIPDRLPTYASQMLRKANQQELFQEGALEVPSLHYLLQSIGLETHLSGYRYLVTGIEAALDDMTLLDSLTKGLYPFIADEHRTCPMSVERSIRYAIKKAREKDAFVNYGLCVVSTDKSQIEAPTNGHFIISIVHYLNNHQVSKVTQFV